MRERDDTPGEGREDARRNEDGQVVRFLVFWVAVAAAVVAALVMLWHLPAPGIRGRS